MGRDNSLRTESSSSLCTLQGNLWRRKCAAPTTTDWVTMRFNEFAIKTSEKQSVALTPQQTRLDALKTQKDNVSKALDAERKRQKVTKAQQNLRNAITASQ